MLKNFFPYLIVTICFSSHAAFANNKIDKLGITHPQLNLTHPLPNIVYRVDTRLPSYIFSSGFTARDINYNIGTHVRGGREGLDTGYVSTTQSRAIAEQMATANRLDLAYACGRSHTGQLNYVCRAYIYTIRPTTANMFYLPDQLIPAYQRYAVQEEWVAIHTILPQQIQQAEEYRVTFQNGVAVGSPVLVSITNNDNYDSSTVFDAEAQGTPFGWSSQTDVGPTQITGEACVNSTSQANTQDHTFSLEVNPYCVVDGDVQLDNGSDFKNESFELANDTNKSTTLTWQIPSPDVQNNYMIDDVFNFHYHDEN